MARGDIATATLQVPCQPTTAFVATDDTDDRLAATIAALDASRLYARRAKRRAKAAERLLQVRESTAHARESSIREAAERRVEAALEAAAAAERRAAAAEAREAACRAQATPALPLPDAIADDSGRAAGP